MTTGGTMTIVWGGLCIEGVSFAMLQLVDGTPIWVVVWLAWCPTWAAIWAWWIQVATVEGFMYMAWGGTPRIKEAKNRAWKAVIRSKLWTWEIKARICKKSGMNRRI